MPRSKIMLRKKKTLKKKYKRKKKSLKSKRKIRGGAEVPPTPQGLLSKFQNSQKEVREFEKGEEKIQSNLNDMNDDSKRLENENKVFWENYKENIESKKYEFATTKLRDLTVKLIDWNTLMSKMFLLITQSETDRNGIIVDLLGRHEQTKTLLQDIPMTMNAEDGCEEAVFGNEHNFQVVIGGIRDNIYNFYEKLNKLNE